MVGLLQWNILYNLLVACLWMRYPDVYCGEYKVAHDGPSICV